MAKIVRIGIKISFGFWLIITFLWAISCVIWRDIKKAFPVFRWGIFEWLKSFEKET